MVNKPATTAAAPSPPAKPKRPTATIESAGKVALLMIPTEVDGKLALAITTVAYETPDQKHADGNVVVIGRDVRQVGLGGFAKKKGQVHVGPAHPVYVALNLAYQAGETDVEVSGVSPALQARIEAFLAKAKGLLKVTFV